MPHRVKNKHRARHRSHTFKAASLSLPALPLPADQTPATPAPDAQDPSDAPIEDKKEVIEASA